MNLPDSLSLGEKICRHLSEEIDKLGFGKENQLLPPRYNNASFSTAADTYSGLESVIGIWRNQRGDRVGEIKIHGDGSFYAEYDVALPHPTDKRWFVEAVIAWGRENVIKTEAKLLPSLGQ